MRSLPSPSRLVLAAAVAALAASTTGFGATSAQPLNAPPVSRPADFDPVSAAITEASRRFGVPESWIRLVMRVESAGNARALSRAGAMGLMQVMPGTYAELRARYGLGPDPFNVRDNVLAGTAYLREMHDRYGVQGMLAAYNAGPARWEAYVRSGRRLPLETVSYLARLGPAVGASTVPLTANAQPLRVPDAPRPTMFVQIGGTASAASPHLQRDPADPSSVTRPVEVEQLESVFVERRTSERAQNAASSSAADDALAARPSPSTHGLFVPISSSPERF